MMVIRNKKEQVMDIKYLAKLSKLYFSDEQFCKLETQMREMISFIDEIKEIDYGKSSCREGVAFAKVREDSASLSLSAQEMLKNSAKTKDGFFVVPKVVE